MNKLLIFLMIFLNISFSKEACKENENFCKKCDGLTGLCIQCQNNVLIPDSKGSCKGMKKCSIEKNYCKECNEEEDLCTECSEGYFPDENGGCSYAANCKLSYNGKCFECKNDYILIGAEEGLTICKSLNSEDFLGCKEINKLTGFCQECEEDYYLDGGDGRCTETKNCYESLYGQCLSCNSDYYLDINDHKKCKSDKNFYKCKESEDGKTCNKCKDDYYFDENGKCTSINYCSESNEEICLKCIDKYYLTEDNNSCTQEKNCYMGDKDSGICEMCSSGYYLDYETRTCKSNTEEDDDLKYCKYFSDNKCVECEYPYNLGEDNKCSVTLYCVKSENGLCIKCSDNYYLGSDNKCSKIKNCSKSTEPNSCDECKDNYYYNKLTSKCILDEGDFENCKATEYTGLLCAECKIGYYLSLLDFKCYSNKEKGKFYKCSFVRDDGTECTECEKGYFLGSIDKKCTKKENCAISESIDSCIKCSNHYCMDLKKGTCEYNAYIYTEETKFYYRCNMTNEEGTKCAVCEEKYNLGDNGLCMDILNCKEKDDDDICIQCQKRDSNGFLNCLNKNFGCVHSIYDNCLKCDNNLDFTKCSKCVEGYKPNFIGICVKEDE